jgi:hypothetical protein
MVCTPHGVQGQGRPCVVPIWRLRRGLQPGLAWEGYGHGTSHGLLQLHVGTSSAPPRGGYFAPASQQLASRGPAHAVLLHHKIVSSSVRLFAGGLGCQRPWRSRRCPRRQRGPPSAQMVRTGRLDTLLHRSATTSGASAPQCVQVAYRPPTARGADGAKRGLQRIPSRCVGRLSMSRYLA